MCGLRSTGLVEVEIVGKGGERNLGGGVACVFLLVVKGGSDRGGVREGGDEGKGEVRERGVGKGLCICICVCKCLLLLYVGESKGGGAGEGLEVVVGMSAVPVRKRQREEQVVPTFDVPKESAVVASVDVESGGGGVGLGGGSGGVGGGVADSDYPIPNFEVLYAEMRHPERGVKSDDRRWRLLTYPKCFVGQEMVDWLMEHVDGEIDRAEAVRLGQKLLDAGIMHHVTKSEPFADEYYFYRFQEDEQTSILNMKKLWDSNRRVRHAVDVAQEAITRLACLCEEHRRKVLLMQVSRGQNVSEKDPEDIDYALLAKSDAFRQYALSSAELQCVDIQSLTTDERLAFFINIYNALCLHGHVVFGAPTNFLKRISFFRGMAYRLGGLDYTLDDIEHGILRGNKRPPSLRLAPPSTSLPPASQACMRHCIPPQAWSGTSLPLRHHKTCIFMG